MKNIINGAFGLAIRADGSVLLTQRNDPTSPAAHMKWQIPGGGQEFGEHLEDTLHREMMEELGLTCTIIDQQPLVGYSVWTEPEQPAVHVNLFVYLVEIGEQVPVIGDPETHAWRWFSLDEVKVLETLPNVKEFVTKGVVVYNKQ